MSDLSEGIPHAEDTFEAGYAAAARTAVARARPGILREAADACFALGDSLPRQSKVRRDQCLACAAVIISMIEKERRP